MTPLAQVRHVLTKDVREFRWLVALYAIVVLVAGARSSIPMWLPGFMAPMAIVVLLGMIAVASVVQADSPTRSDAFWASHPLRASGMIGAKIAFALLLLAVGLVGQAMAIRMYDVPWADLVPLLGASAAATAIWFLVAMILACLTRDIRSFVLVLAAVPVVGFTLTAIIAPDIQPLEAIVRDSVGARIATTLFGVVVVAAGVALVAWLYRSRDARRRTKIAGFAVALAALTASFSVPSNEAGEDLPSSTVRLPVTLQAPPHQAVIDRSNLHLVLAGPTVPDGMHLTFEPEQFTVSLRDGTVMQLQPQRYMAALSEMRIPVGTVRSVGGFRWMNDPKPSPFEGFLTASLTPEQRRAIGGGFTRIVVEGRMIVSEAEVIGTIPLTAGASLVNDGHRVWIDGWTPDPGDPALELQTSRVEHAASISSGARAINEGPIVCALINSRRGEGFMMAQRGTGATNNGLVLPGVGLFAYTTSFRMPIRSLTATEPTIDDAWMQGAELLLVRQVARGGYPVRAELIMP